MCSQSIRNLSQGDSHNTRYLLYLHLRILHLTLGRLLLLYLDGAIVRIAPRCIHIGSSPDLTFGCRCRCRNWFFVFLILLIFNKQANVMHFEDATVVVAAIQRSA